MTNGMWGVRGRTELWIVPDFSGSRQEDGTINPNQEHINTRSISGVRRDVCASGALLCNGGDGTCTEIAALEAVPEVLEL